MIVINWESIDIEYDARHGGSKYYYIAYSEGGYLVYKEYPAFCEQDAIDLFADWIVDNAPGYIPSDDRIAELRAGAIKDGRDDDESYINDFYMRAGNDSHWIEMPSIMREVNEAEAQRLIKGEY
jgi:hypothetical protein